MRLRIGARQSDLARLQALTVGSAIKSAMPEAQIEYFFKASLGDINLQDPLWKMPERGVFTEDFLADLRTKSVDIVVHSWKDLPTQERTDTVIVATLPRADCRDILFLRKDRIPNLKGRLRVYSSSPRRSYNLSGFLRDCLPFDLKEVEFLPVRGNVPTRFKKFMADDVDAFVMAKAAIDRLIAAPQDEFREVSLFLQEQIAKCVWTVLPIKINPPAAAQGALAIEVLKERGDLKEVLQRINHQPTFDCIEEERKILKSYGGGCHQKIGVAVVQKSYGKLRSLQGQTDQGEILNEWSLQNSASVDSSWRFNEREMWPLPSEERNFFERKTTNVAQSSLHGKSLWVAKAEALPAQWAVSKETLVWTSGLETWKKLARRGVWVCGSAEGLGEKEPMLLESLAPRADWVKLSHGDSQEVSSFPMVATYNLVPAKETVNLAGKKCFYWMSGSALQEALRHDPQIREGYHACGPGNTYQFLRKLIGNESRIRIFLDYEDWMKKVSGAAK